MSDLNMPTLWKSLAIAADQGDLYLNADAAAACIRACDEYLDRLVVRQNDAQFLAVNDIWGEFDSGKELRRIYTEKAVGEKNSMVSVLQSHIDVVREMQVVFKKFFVDTGATDDGNAADLGNQGPK